MRELVIVYVIVRTWQAHAKPALGVEEREGLCTPIGMSSAVRFSARPCVAGLHAYGCTTQPAAGREER